MCTKCGTYRQPSGPHYGRDAMGRECLKYRCMECGYSWTQPTRDQQDADDAREEFGKIKRGGRTLSLRDLKRSLSH